MELMTQEIAERLLRSAEVYADLEAVTLEDSEKPIVVKYFTPDAQCSWFILDGEVIDDDWQLFGLCDLGLGSPELGYVMLSELQAARGKLNLPVERDLHYTGTLADAWAQVRL